MRPLESGDWGNEKHLRLRTVALSFAEVCYSNQPFPIIVRETRAGQTRELRQSDPLWKRHFTLFTAGR